MGKSSEKDKGNVFSNGQIFLLFQILEVHNLRKVWIIIHTRFLKVSASLVACILSAESRVVYPKCQIGGTMEDDYSQALQVNFLDESGVLDIRQNQVCAEAVCF